MSQREGDLTRKNPHTQAVFDNAPVGLAHLDWQLRFLSVNKMLAELHGVRPEEHIGRTLHDVLPRDLAELHDVNCRSVIDSGASLLDVSVRVESARHEQALHDWLVSYFPVGHSSRDARGVAMTVVDITNRRDVERRLQAERRVAQVLATADDLDQALPLALDAILHSFELRICEFWTPDGDGRLVRRILRSSPPPRASEEELFAAAPLAFGQGLIGKVIETLEPVWIPDVTSDPEFRRPEAARSLGLRTGFAFPVMVHERCLGVISLFADRRLDIGSTLASVLARLGEEIGQFASRADVKREAREYEARTRAVIESALDAVISIDDEGRVIEWNPRAAEMFGFTRAEAMGADLAKLIIPEADRAAHYAGLAHFLETGEGPVLNQRIEVTAVHRDGTGFPVELAILPLKLEGRYEFTAYVRDITERKRVESALIDADRRKTEFLAILGHELRNPLATIANCVELARRGAELPERMVDVMRPQVEHLRFLLDDLLDITRITHGKIALNRRVLRLGEPLRGAIDGVRSLLSERSQRLETHLDGIWDDKVFADATRLQQIVSNLLTNASKYSPPNSTIVLSGQKTDSAVRISVRDQGIGIAAERLDDIFDAFTQIRETPTSAGGLGIGLTLVRLLTEMHGGTVEVESGGVGCGAEFSIELPATIPADAPVPARPRHASGGLDDAMRILIVDDNEDAAITLARLIEHSSGCTADVAFDGTSALQLARSTVPDVMLVDIQLPDMTGLDIVTALRADERFRDTRMFALSGFGHEEAVAESLAAGFERHLAKPLELPTLVEALKRRPARRSA